MRKGGVTDDMIDLMDTILKYSGSRVRGPGLYGVGSKDIMSNLTKSFMTSVQGVQNVYAQHVPLLLDTIQSITKGKLRRDTHPFVPASIKTVPGVSPETVIPDEIIV